MLLPAELQMQHDAFAGVQSSSGALKLLALKWKSEILTTFYQQTYTLDMWC